MPPKKIGGDFIPFFGQGDESVFFKLYQAELPQPADHLRDRGGTDIELVGQGADPYIPVFLHTAADHLQVILHRLGDLAHVVHLVAFECVEFHAEIVAQKIRLLFVSGKSPSA